MKRIHALLLAAALSLTALASVSPGQSQTPDAQASPAPSATQSPRADAVVAPKTQTMPLVVGIVDTSPSMKQYLEAARRTATEFIKRTPPRVAVAVVGINNEADKSPIYAPERRAEAVEFIARLKLGGRFTDLSRGTDAALALLQEANPSQAVVVYFTDGQLQVPPTFKHRLNFIELLRQEFGERRNNVHVVVVSFGKKQAVAPANVPPNVKIIPVGSDGELQQALENVLTPAVTQHLSASQAQAEQPPTVAPAVTQPQSGSALSHFLAGLLLLSALGAVAFLIRRKKLGQKREARNAESGGGQEESVENILQQSDLSAQSEEAAAEPVALLDIRRLDARPGEASFSRREAVRVAEAVIVGGSEFTGIHLPGLIQPETLRLSFDGAACRVARLRPRAAGKLDSVKLNGESAPIQFQFAPGDVLDVGDFTVSLLLASESTADMVEPQPSAAVEVATLRPASKHRLLRTTAAKGNYDART